MTNPWEVFTGGAFLLGRDWTRRAVALEAQAADLVARCGGQETMISTWTRFVAAWLRLGAAALLGASGRRRR